MLSTVTAASTLDNFSSIEVILVKLLTKRTEARYQAIFIFLIW